MKILHGMCQGNGAAPVAWLVLSSVLVMIYKSLGFRSKMISPITRVYLDITGVLFVDDTDLYIMDECLQTPYDLWYVRPRVQLPLGGIFCWPQAVLSNL